METLKELFEETLKDIYFAEKTIVRSLPKMAKKAKSPELKKAFEEHTEQSKGHVERLDQIFKLLGKKASGKECPALLGLVKEAEEIMSEATNPDVLNAGLIGCAQAVEHYEIARYGTLSAWAKQIDMPEAAALLEATLAEEKRTDENLTRLATGGINQEAEKPDAKGKTAAKPKAAAPEPAAKSPPAKAASGTNASAGASHTKMSAAKSAPVKPVSSANSSAGAIHTSQAKAPAKVAAASVKAPAIRKK